MTGYVAAQVASKYVFRPQKKKCLAEIILLPNKQTNSMPVLMELVL
jgi:hypothetical protein